MLNWELLNKLKQENNPYWKYLQGLKHQLLYSYEDSTLCCGFFGNMGTGAYRGGVDWDYIEDFTGCGTNQCDGDWPSTDTAKILIDTANDELDFDIAYNGGSNDAMARDLTGTPIGGALSDTTWEVLFHKIEFSTLIEGNQAWSAFFMRSIDQTNGSATATDALLIQYILDVELAGGNFRLVEADNAAPSGTIGDAEFNPTLNVAKSWSLQRLTATTAVARVLTTDLATVDATTGTGTMASTIIALKFLTIKNRDDVNRSGNLIGKIPEIRVSDGALVT